MVDTPLRNSSGFTLIEFVIVVTIIALIAGAVLVGGTLIRNAELQSIITDVNKYKNAANMFRDKYKYLPGDFPDAAQFWGVDTGCDASDTPDYDGTISNHIPKQETCGGNGDGVIGGMAKSTDGKWPTADNLRGSHRETYRVWQHLANAGFIEGTYSGANGDAVPGVSATGGTIPGVNLPGSKIDGNVFWLFHAAPISDSGHDPAGLANTMTFPGKYGHIIAYGRGRHWIGKPALNNPGLPAKDALQIDVKIDDGLPAFGSVLTLTPLNLLLSDCVTSTTAATSVYDVTKEGVTCMLIFVSGL